MKLVWAPTTVTDEIFVAYFKALDFVQNELKNRGSKFLDGNQPGFADYMIWPWFERLFTVEDERLTMDEQKYKLLVSCSLNILDRFLIPKWPV